MRRVLWSSARTPGPLVALVAVLAAGACADSSDRSSCPEPTPLPDPPRVTTTIRAQDLGTVVAGQAAEDFATFTIESDLSVAELADRLPRVLGRIGHEPLSVDDEGFEVEIYLEGPASAYSVVRVVENVACDGRSTLQVSLSDDRVRADGGFTA